MAYYHPRDFDNSIHKFLNNHSLIKLRYRVVTNSSRLKLEKLVNEFPFETMKEAIRKFDWNKARVYNLKEDE